MATADAKQSGECRVGRCLGLGEQRHRATLAARLHREIEDARVAVTLLHYEQTNPLSVPFWSQQGYRPLWTSWETRPAAPPLDGETSLRQASVLSGAFSRWIRKNSGLRSTLSRTIATMPVPRTPITV